MNELLYPGSTPEFPLSATGDHDEPIPYKHISYPVAKYTVVVKLTEDDRFLGIEEVQVSKDFLTQKQRFSRLGYHDVDDIYKE